MVEIKIRDQHKAYFVEPEILENRLDYNYYSPEAVDAMSRLGNGENKGYYQMRSLESISSHIMDFQAFSIYNLVEFSKKYIDGWVEFLRVQDLDPIHVDTSKVNWTSPESHQLMPKSVVKPGDLLLSIIGTLGIASLWPDSAKECNSNQCIAKISIKPEFDKYYVAIVLNSPSIQTLIRREAKGTVQKGLTLGGTRKLEIPIPEIGIQAYIGTKVRLAEKCTEEARNRFENAKIAICKILGINLYGESTQSQMIGRHYTVTGEKSICVIVDPDLIGNSISAERYKPNYLQKEEIIASSPYELEGLSSLADDFINGIDSRDYSYQGTMYLRVGNIKPNEIDLSGVEHVQITSTSVNTKFRMCSGDLLITRKGSFGICTTVSKQMEEMLFSSEIIRVPLKNGWDGDYIAMFLNSPFGRYQFDRLSTGTIMKGINHENLAEIKVPKISSENQKTIGDFVREHIWLINQAHKLVDEAKRNVENLIDCELENPRIVSGDIQAPTWNDVLIELQDSLYV